jgi:hypothetical protein
MLRCSVGETPSHPSTVYRPVSPANMSHLSSMTELLERSQSTPCVTPMLVTRRPSIERSEAGEGIEVVVKGWAAIDLRVINRSGA